MRGEELGRARGYPGGEAVVGFESGGDLPAHEDEHYVAGEGWVLVWVAAFGWGNGPLFSCVECGGWRNLQDGDLFRESGQVGKCA